jgi:hypothetical protein
MKLRKMYLVSPEQLNNTKHPIQISTEKRRKSNYIPKKQKIGSKQHPFDKWVRFRKKMREEEVGQKEFIQKFADILNKVLPYNTSRQKLIPKFSDFKEIEKQDRIYPHNNSSSEDNRNTLFSTHEEAIETPKKSIVETVEENSDDGTRTEKDVKDFRIKDFGKIASPYLTRLFDKQYGIRRENGNFMIGDSTLTVGKQSDINIRGKNFKGTQGLWELLTRKNVDRKLITPDDLKTYKMILQMTNAHLEGYEPGGNIQITRGSKFSKVISRLFPQNRRRGVEVELQHQWMKY